MATRATIHVAKREEGVSFSKIPDKTIVDIYHHWDGYPEGVGVTLASYLDDMKIVNGLGRDDTNVANGLGCLAAQLIAEIKDGPGNVSIIGPDESYGYIEFEYYIWGIEYKDIWISIFNDGDCIFVGKPQQLLEKYDTN